MTILFKKMVPTVLHPYTKIRDFLNNAIINQLTAVFDQFTVVI
jgi:hypothetical protein